MPIPPFDHNHVLPPHVGDPRLPNELSPYPCTTLELCQRFATSVERKEILLNFLRFRSILRSHNLSNGFQWLDGSFLENVEMIEGRAPRDLDVVTIFYGYDFMFQNNLITNFPEFQDFNLSKTNFKLDHYPFDASWNPLLTVEYSRYWVQLFSHNRNSVWKGMLSIELNTPTIDNDANVYLTSVII
ncbi:MAG: DUF6932 family protein [Cyclobacteriaceae bacterium]